MDKFLIRRSSDIDKKKTDFNQVKEPGKFKIIHKKSDLFLSPADESLAHCISEDARMGAGIALHFKKKYGGAQEILMQKQKTGGVAVLDRDGRNIYYLITKRKYYNKPTYESLTASLEAMKRHCRENFVRSIAMPRIGCGLDRLRWDKVEQILQDTFRDGDIKITVYTP